MGSGEPAGSVTGGVDAETAAEVAAPLDGGWEVVSRRSDPRLPAYLFAGFGALMFAAVAAQPAIAALGVPFLALLGLGLGGDRAPRVAARVDLDVLRAVEGDPITGAIEVEWDGEAEVDVLLADGRGLDPAEPEPVTGWSLQARSGRERLEFRLTARSWGVHDLGFLWVRVRRPGRYTYWEFRRKLDTRVQVLPSALRISRMLKPSEPRAVSGAHVAKSRGHGTDFAELRPYRPGDRLRDISWGTSARLGIPWVRVSHPERTGTVLIVLDTVFGQEDGEREALARAARATWAVASMHLRAQDRVGLLAQGRTAAWLPPRGGRRARWMLLDELLSIGRAAEDFTRRRRLGARVVVPGDALIVGVTSLLSHTYVPGLLHYRRIGHATVALVIDSLDLLPETKGPVDRAAARIRFAQRESERRLLERGGIPTALVTPEHGVGPAILTLRRRMSTTPQRARMVGGA